ncbi:hypothetical protein IFM61606_03865 [Aspergillus udagawae]|uniref:PH domain-containing protein n=1 Tax=Aspergillus udagawae TaxID=91492 RepID=A0ABQ1B5L7_9EURO|nr:hypothetical protein IFM51744_05528 [Aspergillus udagawae]GFF94193.1 hypothetical protein IFM53868_07458 [Aspergillus udagawae]GFG09780.1 hypothetical protein IFM5058_04594 [Aspergillus udagawae]GFG23970.1 hypothetical protein IFM61606_03865 [Aspergillus udagawae]
MVFYAYASSGGFAVWLITAKDKDTLDTWFRAMETSQFGNIARISAEWYRYQNFRIEHSTTDHHLAQRFDGLILFKPLYGYNDSWHMINNGPFVDCFQYNWYYIRSKKYKSLYWDVQRRTETESLQVYASTKSRARFQVVKRLCPNYAPTPSDHLILGDDLMYLQHESGSVSFIRTAKGPFILTISAIPHHFSISQLCNSFAPQSDDRIAFVLGCGAEWELVY